MEFNFDINEMINSIIEFIKAVVEGVQKALDGIIKTPGYANPGNYPDDFPMETTTEA